VRIETYEQQTDSWQTTPQHTNGKDTTGDTHGATWPEQPAPEAYYGLTGDIVRAIEPHSEAVG
jgi:hypothetical protein